MHVCILLSNIYMHTFILCEYECMRVCGVSVSKCECMCEYKNKHDMTTIMSMGTDMDTNMKAIVSISMGTSMIIRTNTRECEHKYESECEHKY